MHLPKANTESIIYELIKEDWSMLATLMDRIDLTDIKNKRTRYRVIFAKQVLTTHLQNLNGHGTIRASLLIGMLKTIMQLEKEFGKSNHHFLIFAKTVAKKFENQRLLVDKTLEKKLEFKKMKGVVES